MSVFPTNWSKELDTSILKEKREYLSEKVHDAWMLEKTNQGFHSPDSCSQKVAESEHDNHTSIKFCKHCKKCHPDMYPYNELSERIKEYDRVTVDTVLKAIKEI